MRNREAVEAGRKPPTGAPLAARRRTVPATSAPGPARHPPGTLDCVTGAVWTFPGGAEGESGRIEAISAKNEAHRAPLTDFSGATHTTVPPDSLAVERLGPPSPGRPPPGRTRVPQGYAHRSSARSCATGPVRALAWRP